MRTSFLIAVLFIIGGCAAHRPQSWRLQPPMLVPPGVRSAQTARASFTVAGATACQRSEHGVQVTSRRGKLKVTIDSTALATSPPRWLADFSDSLEQDKCLPPGGSGPFAESAVSALALPLGVAYRLVHASPFAATYVDLHSSVRLRVTSPIWRAGGSKGFATSEIRAAPGQGLNVDLRAPDLLGYEQAWYGIPMRPLEVTEVIDGARRQRATSRFAYFDFDPRATLYRLLFLRRAGPEDHDALLIAAQDAPALARLTSELQANPAGCKTMPRVCAMPPADVALAPFIVVTVNGAEVMLNPGALLREAVKDPVALKTLSILKPFRGRLAPVEFDHVRNEILALPLAGGEVIGW